ncbi:MAG: hypothetical protein JWQ16_557 [Novosphingobium sp.]|nr:hypothetical protein [Novosphingobium sp.]
MTGDRSRPPIAVVQGADSVMIQQLFAEVLNAPWRPLRIAGVIELASDDPGVCGLERLHNIGDGRRFALFQDLGSGSTACAVDPGGVADACAAVCQDIAAGCDLVVLSKFGKLEAENGSGLLAAFVAALEAGVPVVTSVSPNRLAQWDVFAAPYYETIAPGLDAIAAWWMAQSPAAASSATT